AKGEPVSEIRSCVRNIPVFAVGIGETAPHDLDGSVLRKMRSQGRNHCFFLREEGGVPKDGNRGLHAVVIEGEETATRVRHGAGAAWVKAKAPAHRIATQKARTLSGRAGAGLIVPSILEYRAFFMPVMEGRARRVWPAHRPKKAASAARPALRPKYRRSTK